MLIFLYFFFSYYAFIQLLDFAYLVTKIMGKASCLYILLKSICCLLICLYFNKLCFYKTCELRCRQYYIYCGIITCFLQSQYAEETVCADVRELAQLFQKTT